MTQSAALAALLAGLLAAAPTEAQPPPERTAADEAALEEADLRKATETFRRLAREGRLKADPAMPRDRAVLMRALGRREGEAVAADERGRELATESYREAEARRRGGDLEGAIEVLDDRKTACDQAEGAVRCRRILDYSQGYLLERQSAELSVEAADQRREYLERSAAAYERVLEADPANPHPPSVRNLTKIYRRLGEDERAKEVLQRALAADPDEAGAYSMLLGDLYLSEKDWSRAETYFRRAAEADPEAEAPRRRLLRIFALETAYDSGALLELGVGWEDRFPDVARTCYERSMLAGHQRDEASAGQALLRWTSALGAGGRFSNRDLDSLPPGWPPADELRSFVAAPTEPPPWGSWWRDDPGRANVLAGVALLLGRERRSRGEAGEAEKIWRAALDLAPPYEEYVMGSIEGEPAMRLDLHSELATLYHNHPELDPGREKFGDLENELFAGKAVAYEVDDEYAVLRFHATLGPIYAERGEWRSAASFRNGIFQLGAALGTARRIEEKHDVYLPLPALAERLGEGFLQVRGELADEDGSYDADRFLRAAAAYLGREAVDSAYSHPSRARELAAAGAASAFLDAARGYLDTDALGSARRCLDRVLEMRPPDSQAAERLFRMLADRDSASGDGARAEGAAEPWARPGWPHAKPADPEGRRFVARQRFKLLADLAAAASGSPELAARALRLAAGSLRSLTGGDVQLVGAGDLRRLERLREIVSEALGLAVERAQVTTRPPPGDLPALRMALPGEWSPSWVRPDPRLLEAVQAIETLGASAVVDLGLTVVPEGKGLALKSARPLPDLGYISVDWRQIVAPPAPGRDPQ